MARVLATVRERTLSSHAVFRDWVFGETLVGRAVAHPGFEIGWCVSGSAEYTIAGRLVTLRPGSAIVVPMEVEHATSVPERGTRARSIHVGREMFDSAADAVGVRVREARLIEGSEERPAALVTLASLLARECEDDRAGRALAVEALTDAVVVEATRAGAASTSSVRGGRGRDPRVRRAIDLIHERHASPLSLDDLASAAGVSRFHFTRLFRAETGKTPFRYLIDVRVSRAARLLRTRGCSVTEAAFAVGCSDLGRFSRSFRRLHGVAPSEYLRRARSAGAAA